MNKITVSLAFSVVGLGTTSIILRNDKEKSYIAIVYFSSIFLCWTRSVKFQGHRQLKTRHPCLLFYGILTLPDRISLLDASGTHRLSELHVSLGKICWPSNNIAGA